MKSRFITLLCLNIFVLTLVACGKQEADQKQEQQAGKKQEVEIITRKINDTGIVWGGDYPKDINEDCSAEFNQDQLAEGEHYEGDLVAYQDCNQGADAAGEVREPAFKYQKVSVSGELLDDDAEIWTCVLDKVSGLLWEVKEAADETYGNRGLHDADDLFTWYNARPDANGGAVGDWNASFNQCTGYTAEQPVTFCNTEEFISRVNKHGYCGRQDWRVPTRAELETLVHFGRSMPAIDLRYFPNTKNDFFWTDTPVVGMPSMAWAVSFQFGFSAHMKRDNGHSVRVVTVWSQQDGK